MHKAQSRHDAARLGDVAIAGFVLGRSGVWGVGHVRREFGVVRVREFGRCNGAVTLSWRDTPLGLDTWLDSSIPARKVVEVWLRFAKEGRGVASQQLGSAIGGFVSRSSARRPYELRNVSVPLCDPSPPHSGWLSPLGSSSQRALVGDLRQSRSRSLCCSSAPWSSAE